MIAEKQKKLYDAILDGPPDEVQALLNDPEIDLTDNMLWLFCTPQGYNIENIKAIVNDGRINLQAENFMALQLSITYGYDELTELLLLHTKPQGYYYGAIRAAQIGNIELCKKCLDNFEIDHNKSTQVSNLLDEIAPYPELLNYVLNHPKYYYTETKAKGFLAEYIDIYDLTSIIKRMRQNNKEESIKILCEIIEKL